MRDFISRFVFAFLISGLCHLSLAQTGKSAQDGYSVGVVPQFTSEQITQIWAPVLEELSKRSNVKLYFVPSRTIRYFEI